MASVGRPGASSLRKPCARSSSTSRPPASAAGSGQRGSHRGRPAARRARPIRRRSSQRNLWAGRAARAGPIRIIESDRLSFEHRWRQLHRRFPLRVDSLRRLQRGRGSARSRPVRHRAAGDPGASPIDGLGSRPRRLRQLQRRDRMGAQPRIQLDFDDRLVGCPSAPGRSDGRGTWHPLRTEA